MLLVWVALATGKGDGFLDGVYKLCMINQNPTLKVSESIKGASKNHFFRSQYLTKKIFSFASKNLF